MLKGKQSFIINLFEYIVNFPDNYVLENKGINLFASVEKFKRIGGCLVPFNLVLLYTGIMTLAVLIARIENPEVKFDFLAVGRHNGNIVCTAA